MYHRASAAHYTLCRQGRQIHVETKTSGNYQGLFICFANGAQSPLLCLPFIVECEMRQVFRISLAWLFCPWNGRVPPL